MSIVLLGQIGSGKTTLYNKITLSQEKTKYAGQSVTLNVFMKKSCYGSGFQVLDTPGFGSNSKKIDHVAGVLSALTQGPITRIFIIIRLNRTDLIIAELKRILPAFSKYRHMFSVIITFWDNCEKEEEETNKSDIQQALAQYKINSVLFVSKNDTAESICLRIDKIIDISKAENINLSENEIFQNFEMTEYDDNQIFGIEDLKTDLIISYNKFFQQAIKKIEQHNISKGLLADYYYAITQFAKQKLDETLKEFEQSKQKDIDKLEGQEQLKAFQIHFQLKSAIFKDYEYIVQLAHEKTHNGKHYSQHIRKCYHCGQIWFKAAGCEGNTVCGRLNEDYEDAFIKEEEAPRKFIVTYKKEILEIMPDKSVISQAITLNEKNKQNLMIDEQKVKNIEKMTLCGETFNVGGAGCKKIINWSEMKPLTEEEMNEILGILDIKLCEKIAESEKLTQQKTLNQQLAYKNDLEKKLQEQLKNINKK